MAHKQEQLNQIILKSIHKYRSSGPNKTRWLDTHTHIQLTKVVMFMFCSLHAGSKKKKGGGEIAVSKTLRWPSAPVISDPFDSFKYSKVEVNNYSERKMFSKFFTSLVFAYKSMSLRRFRIEQLCPSIDSMISLVFFFYTTPLRNRKS